MSTSSKRILAGAVALALCLSPAALAAKTEEPPLVAASLSAGVKIPGCLFRRFVAY